MKSYILLLLLIIGSLCHASDYNKWRIYNSYHHLTSVEDSSNEVFALADGSLFSYDKSDNAITEYSRVSGMADSELSLISYDATTSTLVLIYANQNIDLYTKGSFYNIPDFKDKSMTYDKRVNSVQCVDGKAYLATGFGMLILDLKKREIADSFILNIKAAAAFSVYDYLCVANETGIYGCLSTANPYDVTNWHKLNSHSIQAAGVVSDQLYLLDLNGDVFKVNSNWELNSPKIGSQFKSLKAQNGFLLLSRSDYSEVIDPQTGFVSQISHPSAANISVFKQGAFWFATEDGILGLKASGDTYQTIVSEVKPISPIISAVFNMDFRDGKLYCATGGPFLNMGDQTGAISILENGEWTNITQKEVIEQSGFQYFERILSIKASPTNPDEFMVATSRDGVYVFRNNSYYHRYHTTNSTLESNDGSTRYVWSSALDFDKMNNLWVMNSKLAAPLKMMNSAGKWFSYSIPPLDKVEALDRMLIPTLSNTNQKWILCYFKIPSLTIYDDNGTPENPNDDRYKYITQFADQDGNVISNPQFRAIVEDKEGKIWLGTDRGPFIINNPNTTISAQTPLCYRVKVPRNDGTNLADYLLENVTISCMIVDPANRKWIGTLQDGIYLVSTDGLQTIHHFTKENSPLPSNKIHSMQINPETGDLYIGSDAGLTVYHSDAVQGKPDFSNVYAYPNPVRPEYTGDIIITGLMDNSLVKITDINNQLIYQAHARGGQLTWNGLNASNNRVNSGIYLVYGTSEDGKNGVVTKVLIVR